MTKSLTLQDLDESVRNEIISKEYISKSLIHGVRILPLENHVEEDGNFSEILRITNGIVEGVPSFKVAQLNRTRINPHAIKAWHLHLKQDVLWYVSPSSSVFIGLWDLRNKSKTQGMMNRLILGEGKSQLLFIPRGVAHGSANFSSNPIDLYYFTNQKFHKDNLDEKRLPWDSKGKEFWVPKND